jgi:hypothetical protein
MTILGFEIRTTKTMCKPGGYLDLLTYILEDDVSKFDIPYICSKFTDSGVASLWEAYWKYYKATWIENSLRGYGAPMNILKRVLNPMAAQITHWRISIQDSMLHSPKRIQACFNLLIPSSAFRLIWQRQGATSWLGHSGESTKAPLNAKSYPSHTLPSESANKKAII